MSTAVPLGPGGFSGGDYTVAKRLQVLGFEVLNLKRDWTRDIPEAARDDTVGARLGPGSARSAGPAIRAVIGPSSR